MKTSLKLACCLICTMMGLVSFLDAQDPLMGGYPGGQVYEPAAIAPGVATVGTAFPGRMWAGITAQDQGVGYQGTYATFGYKTRLFEDRWDGRWLTEGRFHHTLERGGFFGNWGIERVFTLESAGADIALSAWIDFDDNRQTNFAHSFASVGVNGAIKTQRWDLIGNGYFPQGTNNYALGDPNGVNCFVNNNIVVLPGIDSALEGFDVTLRMRPAALAFVNGSVDVGGYGYSSELIEFFGGGRGRLNIQLWGGLLVSGELAYDEQFDVTGNLSLTYLFGVNARGSEYASLGRDLERTQRNDQIVRVNNDVVLAIDPDTGRPYNVWHVDNSADASVADGTVDRPFTSLADAEAASGEDDIIFVREGFGTTFGYDTGIQLRNRQMLLGDGVEHIIPLADGTNFVLCNPADGFLPTITGRNNGAAVSLANDNVVRGFNIDGSQSVGGMAYGIHGNGVGRGSPIDRAVIEDNLISGAILHGVFIEQSVGDFTYARNTITSNGFDGIFMDEHCDPASTVLFEDNIASLNGRDGIHMADYDAALIRFLRNTTNANGRDGVRMEGFKNTAGVGLDLEFIGHTASFNNGNGINIIDGDGNLRIVNSSIVGNLGTGINIVDFTNTDPADMTLIGTTFGGSSTITSNSTGIEVLLTGGTQSLLITDSVIDSNNNGIITTADGLGTALFTDIIDNLSVSGNLVDGMRFFATGGATNSVLIDQPTGVGATATLNMIGNGAIAGNGISFFAGDASGLTSVIDATVRNVNINSSGGNGIGITTIGDGALDLFVEASNIDSNLLDGINAVMDNDGTGIVNSITVQNTTLNTNGLRAFDMITEAGTFTDLVLINNVMNTGILDGVRVLANGDDGTLAVDNRTRVLMRGNTVNGFLANGINLNATGDAHLLANLEGNSVTGNGFGIGTLPFFHGVNVATSDSAEAFVRMTNNVVTGNAERGLNMLTVDTSSITAVLLDNALGGNDLGDDPGVGGDFLIDDITVNNGVTGAICLSMSNNSFSLLPPDFVNNSAPIFFLLELDGLTNGFGFGDVTTGFTPAAFGSTCDPLITAEEMAFLADGFPPQ